MPDIEYAKDCETRLPCCALHDPELLNRLFQALNPAAWSKAAAACRGS